jgi:uncharacterized MAPEG superfamily protein
MKYRTRTYYTDNQKALMWERWKEGWTLHQIAQLFNRAHTSVQGILARTGGIRPPPRSRSAIALTLAEREEISRAVVERQSIRSIAARLGRAPSTVSRETKRNGGLLARAHANCLEGLPIFGGPMLVALATGRASVTDPLAFILLGARLVQSGIHLSSLSSTAVTLRFSAFAVQMGIAVFWSAKLLLG